MIKLAIVGLYIGSGSFGGVNNYIKLLLDHIDRDEFDVHYYSLGKSPNWYEGEDKPTLLEFEVNLIKKLIFFFFFLKKNRIEVAHFNSVLTQASLLREGTLALIAKFAGCRTLFFIHGWKEKEFDKILENRFKKKILINILNKQNGIAVLAKQFKGELIDLGIDHKKIRVTSTMVESNRYLPQNKIFFRPYKILICVNMIKKKGIFELIEAVTNVLKKFPNSKFIFAGNGKDLIELKQKTKKMNLEKNVIFTGYIIGEEKNEIFKNAQIFAFPSYTEGFPTVILEAMAAGAALIFTPVGGLVDALVDGKNGYVVKSMPPNPEEISEKIIPNPEEISEKIIKLIKSPELMKKISNNNIKRAKEEFDAKVVSRQIVDIYHIIQR